MVRVLTALALALTAACATSGSNLERNKAIARRAFSEILEKGRFEAVSEVYAPDFRNGTYTLEQDMDALRAWHRVMPRDATMRPDLLVAEGDYVSVLWTFAGTIEGRPLRHRGITIWRIVDGRIREEWSQFDEEAVSRELGLTPASAAPAAR